MSPNDEYFLRRAITLAKRAENMQEVPIGAVVTFQEQIIGVGWNCPISQQDPTAHAEIMALRAAAKTMDNYRLPNTTLYVTLEPCLMCIGAIMHARVSRVVFGAYDPKLGATKLLHEKIVCQGGILETECAQLLQNFFQARR